MENDKTVQKLSFDFVPGMRINFGANLVGRRAVRIDFGDNGSVYLWLRREDGLAIECGDFPPEITLLDDRQLDDGWPTGDSDLNAGG